MALNFIAETPDGKKEVSFRDIHHLESKIGLQYRRSDDGLINLVPKDKETENTIKMQEKENAQALAVANNIGALSVNSPFLSHVKRDSMKKVIAGRLELFKTAQYGNSIFVKDDALSIAVSQLTDSKLNGLVTKQREGLSFSYDEEGGVGAIHDRLLKGNPSIAAFRKRPLEDAIPNVTEYYYPDGGVAARINSNGEDLQAARSELYRFNQYFRVGNQLSKKDVTVQHPEFNREKFEPFYERELSLYQKELDAKKQAPDDMKNNIERPSLRPG